MIFLAACAAGALFQHLVRGEMSPAGRVAVFAAFAVGGALSLS